jgi:uncharacterized protein YndB with AHSA1/START domain
MSVDIRAEVSVAGTRERVFQALTDNVELERWFAEHAAVALDDGRYDFWGRFTPEAPGRDQGHHPLDTGGEADLTFRWQLRGAATTVAITLIPEASGTRVVVLHNGIPERQEDEPNYFNFWIQTLANLRRWVEDGSTGLRCDHGGMPYNEVRVVAEIDGSREAVYELLATPDGLDQWIGRGASVEPRVSGRMDFGWGDGGPQCILAIEPNTRLSYGWNHHDPVDTIVTWQLEDSGGGTRLTLVHSGFGDDRRADAYTSGWAMLINHVRNLIEHGSTWGWPDVEVVRADDAKLLMPA